MKSQKKDAILGIIFPVLPEHLQRFFESGKKVFVKFVARAPRRLQVPSKLFFYESRRNKTIVAEARIVDMSDGTIKEVYEKFGDALFLAPAELEDYAGNRESKRMLVLVLEDVRKYRYPLRLKKSVTMAGRYMTREMFRCLRKRDIEVIPPKLETV